MTDARAALDAAAVRVVHTSGPDDGSTYAERDPAPYAALAAVLDRHEPFQYGDEEEEFDDPSCRWCRACTGGDQWRRVQWPCPTVRAITTALETA